MWKLVWFIVPAIVLGALLYTSPVTERGIDSLASQMSIYTAPAREMATPERNAELGRRAFVGRDINTLLPNRRPLDPECAYTRALEINCTYWNETGLIQRRGRQVRILAEPGGKVVEVTVTRAQEKGFFLGRAG